MALRGYILLLVPTLDLSLDIWVSCRQRRSSSGPVLVSSPPPQSVQVSDGSDNPLSAGDKHNTPYIEVIALMISESENSVKESHREENAKY